MQFFVTQFINFIVNILAGLTSVLGALAVTVIFLAIIALSWQRRRRREGKPGVQASHILLVGIAGLWLSLTATLGAAAWMIWNGEGLASTPKTAQQSPFQGDGPLQWAQQVDVLLGPNDSVRWLFFHGINGSQKEVELRDANLTSAINGSKLQLQVGVGIGEFVPIDKIRLIPPGARLDLVATFEKPNDAGMEPGTFLETWRQFFLNVKDDTKDYRIPFNEGHLAHWFPGRLGPRVTRKPD